MNHCRPFLAGVYGLGAESVYGAESYSGSVKTMQAAMQRLGRTWPAANPTRVDGYLDQGTVQVLVNISQSIPGIPSSVNSILRIAWPAAIAFGWNSSQGRQVRVQIMNAAAYIAPAITAFAMKRELGGQGATPPQATGGAGAAGAAPMSLGLKIGIGLGVGGIVLLLAMK